MLFDFTNSIQPKLAAFAFNEFPKENVVYGTPKDQIVVARNRVMADVVLNSPPHITDFVFFDEDMQPDRRTSLMFEMEGDVVGCEYPLDSPVAWMKPTDVHCGALRFKRAVAEKLTFPYFAFRYNGAMTACTHCECNLFIEKAVEAGFSVVRAGQCGHAKHHSWCGR